MTGPNDIANVPAVVTADAPPTTVVPPVEVVAETPGNVPATIDPGAPPAVVDAPPATPPAIVETQDAPPVVADAPPVDPNAPAPSLLERANLDGTLEAPPAAVPAVVKPPAEAPAAAPAIEYKYELPAELTMTDEQRTSFHAALDAYRANPADPTPILQQGVEMMKRYDQTVRAEQFRVFDETKAQWRKQVEDHEILGGSGQRTAMGVIAQMRDQFVSAHPKDSKEYAEERKAFIDMLNYSGVGDNPAFLLFLYNVGRMFRQPAPPAVTDTAPPPNPHAGVRGARGRNPLHDNPRSAEINGRG